MPIDPITAVTTAGALLKMIPNGGKRRKFAAELLEADEVQLAGIAADFRTIAQQGESMGPGALLMAARMLDGMSEHLDAIGDVLTKEDDPEG